MSAEEASFNFSPIPPLHSGVDPEREVYYSGWISKAGGLGAPVLQILAGSFWVFYNYRCIYNVQIIARFRVQYYLNELSY